jgi:hypothetical protein
MATIVLSHSQMVQQLGPHQVALPLFAHLLSAAAVVVAHGLAAAAALADFEMLAQSRLLLELQFHFQLARVELLHR